MYPDAYEVGLPNQGLMILYEVLNERPDALAERTYAVWPDLAGLMREDGVGQFTVDGTAPVRAFDLLGVSFATELGYTNLLEALDLADVPMFAVDRDETPPRRRRRRARGLQPRADQRLRRLRGARRRRAGRRRHHRRRRRLEVPGPSRRAGRAAGPAGPGRRRLRAPVLRGQLRAADGTIAEVLRTRDDVPARVGKRTVMDLDEWPYPKPPLGPLAERCTSGSAWRSSAAAPRCRFCQAGMITRPVRERTIAASARWSAGLAATGYEEVGLLSAVQRRPLRDRRAGHRARRPVRGHQHRALAAGSTRVDAFNVTLANELSRNGRRSGLTFAPEGGSERIRRVINKTVSKEGHVAGTVTTAYANGWRQVKLYFMCGLPTETDEDVLEIAELAVEVIRAGREASGTKDVRCTVSIGGFVPKPSTPFQWAGAGERGDHRPPAAGSCARRSTLTAGSAAPSACATTTASPA